MKNKEIKNRNSILLKIAWSVAAILLGIFWGSAFLLITTSWSVAGIIFGLVFLFVLFTGSTLPNSEN